MHLLSCLYKGSNCHSVTHLTDTRGHTTTIFKATSHLQCVISVKNHLISDVRNNIYKWTNQVIKWFIHRDKFKLSYNMNSRFLVLRKLWAFYYIDLHLHITYYFICSCCIMHALHVHLNILKAMIFHLIHLCNEKFLDLICYEHEGKISFP